MALGAGRRHVLRSALGRGLTPVAVGLAIGAVTALLSSGAMAGLLYEVEPGDPTVLAAVVAILGGTGLLATGLPARQASRIDPARILRDE